MINNDSENKTVVVVVVQLVCVCVSELVYTRVAFTVCVRGARSGPNGGRDETRSSYGLVPLGFRSRTYHA